MADLEDARRTFEQAQLRHAGGDIKGGLQLARRAIELDPGHVQAIEHVANVLITRQRNYPDGLALIDRTIELRPRDAGMWYTRGWCYEFAAHELGRRPTDSSLDAGSLLVIAAESFRRCLELGADGKLADDAADLLDHVENALKSLE